MPSNPTVAAILAAKDAESTVGEAIASAMRQTVPISEIIVVSDGSTDSTASIANQVLKGRGEVIELRQSLGRAGARNLAVEQTSSEFLMICDADDVSEPTRVEALLARWRQTQATVIGGQARLATKAGRVYGRTAMPIEPEICKDLALAGEMPIVHPSCIIQREAFLSLGGYDSRLTRAQDLNLIIRIAKAGFPVANAGDTVVTYSYPIWLGYKRFCEEQTWANTARVSAEISARPAPSRSSWVRWNGRRVARTARTRTTNLSRPSE